MTLHYVKQSLVKTVGYNHKTQYHTDSLFLFFTVLGSSGKKVVFHHRLDLLFVAPFPNAMIKNNNIDNSVPSTKQWTEIPTSV